MQHPWIRALLCSAGLAACCVWLLCFGVGSAGARTLACRQWSIKGAWATSQGNDFHVMFDFTQTRKTLGGTASLSASEQARAGYASPNAKITGTINGNHLSVRAYWKRGSATIVGQYIGMVSRGSVRGNGRDITDPGAAAVSWSGTGPTSCLSTH